MESKNKFGKNNINLVAIDKTIICLVGTNDPNL